MVKRNEFPGAEDLSEDEVIDGELSYASRRYAIARIEKVMHDLAEVAENVIDDCDP